MLGKIMISDLQLEAFYNASGTNFDSGNHTHSLFTLLRKRVNF